jgi:hypothetical protein
MTVAVDSSGDVFTVDQIGIRKITPNGVVTNVTDSAGNVVRSGAIALDSAGNLYTTDNYTILKGSILKTAPAITGQSRSQTISSGSTVVLTMDASGWPTPSFRWTKNGVALTDATNATLVITNANAATYACTVSNESGSVTGDAITLAVSSTANVGRIVNFSTRAPAGTGAETLNLGVVIGGGTANAIKPVLARAVGPSLARFGVSAFLPDPKFDLYAGPIKISENDDWGGDRQVSAIGESVGAFSLGEATSKDAALYQSLVPGTYTMVLMGVDSENGVGLAEIYDATPADAFSSETPRFINASARAQVGVGGGRLIVGFVIDGETSKTVLVRAVGPSLTGIAASDRLADPRLELYSGSSRLRENDNWGDVAANADALAQVGAFSFASDSKDAALLVTLSPGAYTVQVSGAGNSTGVALVELYELP